MTVPSYGGRRNAPGAQRETLSFRAAYTDRNTGAVEALIIWAGSELVKLGQQSVVLEERLTTQGLMIQEMRQELKSWGDTYYRASDARRDLDEIESRIDNLNSRVSALETE